LCVDTFVSLYPSMQQAPLNHSFPSDFTLTRNDAFIWT